MSPREAAGFASGGEDDQSPLLPNENGVSHGKGEREGQATMVSVCSNLTNTLIGTGCLALSVLISSPRLLVVSDS